MYNMTSLLNHPLFTLNSPKTNAAMTDSGVLSIGVVRTDTSLSFEYPFNVEGYQYV